MPSGPTPPPVTGRPGNAKGSTPRFTFFQWADVCISPVKIVTPAPGEEAPPVVSAEEHIKRSLGFGKARALGDDRPLLVHFHWPHDDAIHGKLQLTLCGKALDDETLARWGLLFRCVQVDVATSDKKLTSKIGMGEKPGFAILDHELAVITRIKATKSPTKIRKALEKALRKFPAYRKKIKAELKQHKAWLVDAKQLEKAGELQNALDLVNEIRCGDLRIGKDFDKACTYGALLEKKIEQHEGR